MIAIDLDLLKNRFGAKTIGAVKKRLVVNYENSPVMVLPQFTVAWCDYDFKSLQEVKAKKTTRVNFGLLLEDLSIQSCSVRMKYNLSGLRANSWTRSNYH